MFRGPSVSFEVKSRSILHRCFTIDCAQWPFKFQLLHNACRECCTLGTAARHRRLQRTCAVPVHVQSIQYQSETIDQIPDPKRYWDFPPSISFYDHLLTHLLPCPEAKLKVAEVAAACAHSAHSSHQSPRSPPSPEQALANWMLEIWEYTPEVLRVWGRNGGNRIEQIETTFFILFPPFQSGRRRRKEQTVSKSLFYNSHIIIIVMIVKSLFRQ